MALRVRNLLVLLVIAAAVGGGGYALYRWRQASAKPAVEFETAKVERGKVVARVTATGTLSALVTVQVGSQVSGRIDKLFVDFNSQVKAGQLIAKLEPQLFQAAVDQTRANYVAAQGGLAKAEAQARDAQRQFDRAKGLVERKLIAQADFDTAEANLDVAKAQIAMAKGTIAQAKAALNQAEVNLQYTKIVSPTDGVVISRSVDVGQTVAASLQAPTLFVIAQDLRKMQVDTSVTEADIGKLKAGMPATFSVDAFPGRFRGQVRQIRNAATTVQNVVTYDAVIDVDNSELKLRPGMTANVTFIWAEKDDVVKVPNAALRFRPTPEIFTALKLPVPAGLNAAGGGRGPRPAGGGAAPGGSGAGPAGGGARPRGGDGKRGDEQADRTVWLQRDGRPEAATVKTGVSDGSVTEIVEGSVREGDLVIVDASIGGTPAAKAGAPSPAANMRRIF
jgi:HlyD family secretion protein